MKSFDEDAPAQGWKASVPHSWDKVVEYLGDHGFAVDHSFEPKRFSGGLANLNYLLKLGDGKQVVFRRPPLGPVPRGAHDMVREHRILQDLWRALPIAPRSYHLCEDLSVAGAPFQLLEFKDGICIRGDRLDGLPRTNETGAALSRTLINGLAAVHAVDLGKIGLADLGRPQGFMARTVRGWAERAAAVRAQPSKALSEITIWLDQHAAPLQGEVVLLHNDFKLDNILLDEHSLQPVAVLDWDMGTRGDALFDLATTLSYWSEPGDPECMHRLAQMPTARPGFFTREQAVRVYGEITGRDLSNFKSYRVAAMLKLSVVFHQLHARYVGGEVVDQRYADFGLLADELLDFTLDIIAERHF